jgi:protein PhnA
MTSLPACPQCQSTLTYEDGPMLVCPECAHEWSPNASSDGDAGPESSANVVKDAHGVLLADGDSVVLIKDLKIKGSSSAVKVGTKVKGIRLIEGDHNIDCKIAGFGAMQLKSEFVKKA